MRKFVRKIYNQLDVFVDKSIIHAPINKRGKLPHLTKAMSAREAFEVVWPQVRKFDRKALLYSLNSGSDIDEQGYASRWSFSFDLPSRLAILIAEVSRPSAEKSPEVGAILEISVVPFADKEGTLSTMAREGDIFYQQIRDTWLERITLRRYLPKEFVDSVDALSKFHKRAGTTLKGQPYTLSAKVMGVDGAVWVIEAPHQQATLAFSA